MQCNNIYNSEFFILLYVNEWIHQMHKQDASTMDIIAKITQVGFCSIISFVTFDQSPAVAGL